MHLMVGLVGSIAQNWSQLYYLELIHSLSLKAIFGPALAQILTTNEVECGS